MNVDEQERSCHLERSERSVAIGREILSAAKDDRVGVVEINALLCRDKERDCV